MLMTEMRVKMVKNKKGYCYVIEELHSAVLQYPPKPVNSAALEEG